MSGPRNPIPYNKMRPQGCIFYTGLDKIRRSIFNDGMRFRKYTKATASALAAGTYGRAPRSASARVQRRFTILAIFERN